MNGKCCFLFFSVRVHFFFFLVRESVFCLLLVNTVFVARFVTGSNDRTIKIWDLASGVLKLTLTGHISIVRALCVSNRHPYLFSTGDDKTVHFFLLKVKLFVASIFGLG